MDPKGARGPRKTAITLREPLYPPDKHRTGSAAGPSRPRIPTKSVGQGGAAAAPRPRLNSSAPRRDTPAARLRAVTLQGPPPATLQLGQISRPDPEMQKNLIHGLEKYIKDFVGLNTRIQRFATDWATFVAETKELPDSHSLDSDGPVGKSASEFPSAEDYAFLSLSAIIVTHLYNDIFRHFHPAATEYDAEKQRNYERQRQIALQLGAAGWRANQYKDLDSKVNETKKAQLLRGISSSIQRVWLDTLEILPGDLDDLPNSFESGVESILEAAYNWHRVAKTEVAKLDFEAFAAQPSDPFDADRMEPFERLRIEVKSGRPIISVVSLGLVASAAFSDRRVSHVQFKTKVLVEEGLANLRSRPASHGTAAASGAAGPSKTPPMTTSGNTQPSPVPTPAPKKKTCICF